MCISLILTLLQEVPLGTSSSIEVAVSYNDNAVDAEVESEEVPAVETVAGDNASLTNAGSRARSAEDSAVPSVEDSPPQDNVSSARHCYVESLEKPFSSKFRIASTVKIRSICSPSLCSTFVPNRGREFTPNLH